MINGVIIFCLATKTRWYLEYNWKSDHRLKKMDLHVLNQEATLHFFRLFDTAYAICISTTAQRNQLWPLSRSFFSSLPFPLPFAAVLTMAFTALSCRRRLQPSSQHYLRFCGLLRLSSQGQREVPESPMYPGLTTPWKLELCKWLHYW